MAHGATRQAMTRLRAPQRCERGRLHAWGWPSGGATLAACLHMRAGCLLGSWDGPPCSLPGPLAAVAPPAAKGQGQCQQGLATQGWVLSVRALLLRPAHFAVRQARLGPQLGEEMRRTLRRAWQQYMRRLARAAVGVSRWVQRLHQMASPMQLASMRSAANASLEVGGQAGGRAGGRRAQATGRAHMGPYPKQCV